MAKIVEIEERLDADRDDECYEIDPAELAKNLNLKAYDDVFIVATKGQIKVEVNQPEDSGITLNCYDSEDTCYFVDAPDNLHEYAAGDCMDNPYEIDEDESTLHKVDNEDKCVHENLSAKNITDVLNDGKCVHVDEDERSFEVIPDKSPVKCEPENRNGVEEDAYCPEMGDFDRDELYPEQYRVFDEEDDDDFLVVGREAL